MLKCENLQVLKDRIPEFHPKILRSNFMMGVGAFLIDKFQIDCAAILFGRYRPIKKISSVYNQIIMYNKELTLIQLVSFCFVLYFIGLTPDSLTPIYL